MPFRSHNPPLTSTVYGKGPFLSERPSENTCPAHACASRVVGGEGGTQGLGNKRDAETEEETRGSGKAFNRTTRTTQEFFFFCGKTRDVLPASLHCLIRFGVGRHLILTYPLRTGGGATQGVTVESGRACRAAFMWAIIQV